jgi:hypothetical protein
VAVGDQAHDRLALILTDHLAEVILDREVNTQLAYQLPDHLVAEIQAGVKAGRELPPALAQAVEDHLTPEQRKQLDQHLKEKIRYLVKRGWLIGDEQSVLLGMHEYRNAAYHRDTLDGPVIGDLVTIL